MGLVAKESGGGNFESVEAGTHLARCIRLIDIGTQHGEYQGKPVTRQQLIVMWEYPTEVMQDGKPFIGSKFYTNSLSEKANLRKDLESWRGKAFAAAELEGFDLRKLLGQPCLISVIKKDDKTKISGISSVPKGMQCPPQVNPSLFFDIDAWDQAAFDSLSDGIKKLIMSSEEYKQKAIGADGEAPPNDDDDVPDF